MKRLFSIVLTIVASTVLVSGHPQDTTKAAKPDSAGNQAIVNAFAATLTKYYVGFADKGPKYVAENDAVSQQTSAYLGGLVQQGKLVGVGKVTDAKFPLWVLFLKGGTVAQNKEILEATPAVTSGRYAPRIRTVWGTKGMSLKMTDAEKKKYAEGPGKRATYFIAVFRKGVAWSREASETTKKKIGEHVAEIWKLHEAGKLKFYGVFEDEEDVRGFAVIDAPTMEDARALLDKNPGINNGWLHPEYYTFEIAAGMLP